MNASSALKTLQAQVSGMDCGGCAKTIAKNLEQLSGVTEAQVSFASQKLKVTYDPQQVQEAAICDRVTALGYDLKLAAAKTLQAQVKGMDCGGCAKTIAKNLEELPGITTATVNFASERLYVHYDPQQLSEADILKRVTDLGYTLEPEATQAAKSAPSALGGWQFWLKTRRGQTVLLSGLGLIFGLIAQHLLSLILISRAFYALSLIIGLIPILRSAWIALKLKRADMNLLMTLAAMGTAILNQWFQGALVIFLFALGTTLQTYALGRTRNAIRDLMDLTPAIATVKRNGQEVNIPVAQIQLGEVLTIRPGQRIALDGNVIAGTSAVDQSPITGESVLENKEQGEQVFAGSLNQTGFLEVEVTHTAEDTTVARIIDLVEKAQESRAPIQQWVDRFSAVYTPIVLLLAAGVALVPPLLLNAPFQPWFYKALVLLVIACPCGLVIATPVSLISAIGAATRQGVLFKGGHALETAGQLKTLAFDKTGTITQGMPGVENVYALDSVDEKKVLQIAASLEQQSEHSLGNAIVTAAQTQALPLETPASFTAIPGKGIWAQLKQTVYGVGNRRLFEDKGIQLSPDAESLLTQIENRGQTPVLIGTHTGLIGAIALADGIRLEATEAIHSLKKLGFQQIMMLTGDKSSVAQKIAQQVGINQVEAELLPEDKLHTIEKLRSTGRVGMVGDGINDTPALAAADVSFAVGKLDVALEVADVVLVGNDLRRLSSAIQLSRRTLSVIQQSIVIALVLNGTFVVLGLLGVIGLPVAVLEDMGSSLLVTFNAMRLFKAH